MGAGGAWIARQLPVVLLGFALPSGAWGQGFQRTEAQYQGGPAVVAGSLSPPGFQHTLTLQHASAWSRGSNFFFVDMVCCDDPVSNRDIYLEWYSYLDLGAMTGKEISWGPLRGIRAAVGVNWGAQAQVSKFTPGMQFALDLPGFAFANLDVNYLVDLGPDSRADGVVGLDFNWARPFEIGGESFSVEGHGEWQSPHRRGDGASAPFMVLLQPQVRYDLGKRLSGTGGRLLVGVELQVWINKFAVEGADEFLPQLLVVFGF